MADHDLAFALAAYHADHGEYPAKLAELMPKYVKKIPTDMFNGDADLHYVRKGDGYRLYSVGPNGHDDGGRGMADREKSTDPAANDWDDIGVRVGGGEVAGTLRVPSRRRQVLRGAPRRNNQVSRLATRHSWCKPWHAFQSARKLLDAPALFPSGDAPSTMAAMRESPDNLSSPASSPTAWRELADRVLEGHRLSADEGLAILRAPDEELLDLLAAAYRVRLSLVRQSGGLELPDQRQERTLRRGLRLLFAVAGVEGRDSPLPAGHGRSKCSTAPGKRTERGRKPTAPSSPAARRAIGSLTAWPRPCRAMKAEYGLKVCFSVGLLSARTGPAAQGGRRGPR